MESGSLISQAVLINHYSHFVRYTPGDEGDGVFRLSHHSVHTFLLDHSRKIDPAGPRLMVDPDILACACHKYLVQERYSMPLVKQTSLVFKTSKGGDIRSHKFLQYSAKYWYRHLEEAWPTEALSAALNAFVKSPHFVTVLQVQSLFVPGHFFQDLECDYKAHRRSNKNLPDGLKATTEGKRVFDDYRDFLAEWGVYLQRGVADKVNGELDRCLRSALGPSNYFSRYGKS